MTIDEQFEEMDLDRLLNKKEDLLCRLLSLNWQTDAVPYVLGQLNGAKVCESLRETIDF